MNSRSLSRFLMYAALLIITGSCAKISAPTGGLRDKLPPVVIKSVPENGSVNFRGERFEITFNEFVVLDNINDKFMVSPPLKKKPRVYVKGKNVIADFEEALRDSTTYTFYFQDAIKDLNEGNILDNFQFVFSTGSVIDSLSVTGNAYNAFNLNPPEKSMVLLYSCPDDTAATRSIPDYISRISQTGYFRIDNVKQGKYRLYALRDDDNSRNYNLPDEEFAFMKTPVEITSENNYIPVVKDTTTVKKTNTKPAAPVFLNGEHQLYTFVAPHKNHYLTSSARPLKYLLSYTVSLPPDSMSLGFSIPGSDAGSYFLETSRNRDSVKVWITDSVLYNSPVITTLLKFPFTDSMNVVVYREDTIPLRFTAPRPPKSSRVKKIKYTVDNNISQGFLKPGQNIVFNSKTPLRQPDTSRIRIYDVTDPKVKQQRLQFTGEMVSSERYVIKAPFLQDKKYLFIADSAALGNIYGENIDSTGIRFSVRNAESYSKLTLNITGYEGGRIIQLLDNSEKLIGERYMEKDGKILFQLLDNGDYRVRVVYDLNGDRRWTTGDFSRGLQPEPVSFYPGEIKIKVGWDAEQDWDITNLNSKESALRIIKTGK
jgi:hypothetical protein